MIKEWHEWWRLYHWKKISKHELKFKKHTVKVRNINNQ